MFSSFIKPLGLSSDTACSMSTNRHGELPVAGRYDFHGAADHFDMPHSEGPSGFPSDYGGCGTGGFLSGATQDVGAELHTFSANGAGNDRRHGGEGQKTHPLKACVIQRYFLENPQEHRIRVLGDEVTMLKLVGLIRNLNIDDTSEKWSFHLDDGTGIIPVEWLPARHRDYLEGEPSAWMQKEMSRIRENTYVRVHGDINLLGQLEPHISAFFVSSIDIPEEIFYHDIQMGDFLTSKLCSSSESSTCRARGSLENGDTTPGHTPVGPLPSVTTGVEEKWHGAIRGKPLELQGAKPSVGQGPRPPSRTADVEGSVADIIVEVLRNVARFKPEGLTEEDIMTQLVGRGITGLTLEALEKECVGLMKRGRIAFTDSQSWRATL